MTIETIKAEHAATTAAVKELDEQIANLQLEIQQAHANRIANKGAIQAYEHLIKTELEQQAAARKGEAANVVEPAFTTTD